MRRRRSRRSGTWRESARPVPSPGQVRSTRSTSTMHADTMEALGSGGSGQRARITPRTATGRPRAQLLVVAPDRLLGPDRLDEHDQSIVETYRRVTSMHRGRGRTRPDVDLLVDPGQRNAAPVEAFDVCSARAVGDLIAHAREASSAHRRAASMPGADRGTSGTAFVADPYIWKFQSVLIASALPTA